MGSRLAIDFLILGPIEAHADGGPLAIGGPRQRALLAYLVLHANRVVSTDTLIDELWSAPPGDAAAALQNQVARLRKTLGDRLVTKPPGYLLRTEPAELDLDRFRALVAEAGGMSDPGERSRLLRAAGDLFRGTPFAELDAPFVAVEGAALEELRLAALQERVDADLDCGRHVELVPELRTLIARHPLLERLRLQLALALYRCDRQAEALEACRAAGRMLDEELGLDPSPALRDLQRRILLQDPALAFVPPPPRTDVSAEPPDRPRARRGRRAPLLAAAAVAAGAAVTAAVVLTTSGGSPETDQARAVVQTAVGRGSVSATIVDDFSEKSPHLDLWNVGADGQGGTWALQGGELLFSVPASAQPGGAYDQVGPVWGTRCSFTGDFDERIDFRLRAWSPDSGARVQLDAWVNADADFSAAGRASQEVELYTGNVDSGYDSVATADRSGSLRLARIRGTETAYYLDHRRWVPIYTGKVPGEAQLGIQLFATATDWRQAPVTVAFDNFAVTGTGMVCR